MISISRTLSALLVAAMSFSTPAFADESASSAVLPAAASTASIGATTNDGPAYGPELEGFEPRDRSHGETVLEMGGRTVESQESRVSEASVRGSWQTYRKYMGL